MMIALLFAFVVGSAAAPVWAHPAQDATQQNIQRYSGHRFFRVLPETKAHILAAKAFTSSASKFKLETTPQQQMKAFEVIVPPESQAEFHAFLKTHKMNAISADVKELFDNEKKINNQHRARMESNHAQPWNCKDANKVPTSKANTDCIVAKPVPWTSRFHTYNETIAWIHELHEKYPDITSLVEVGKSYENRQQLALRVTGGEHTVDSSTGLPKSNGKPGFWIEALIHPREYAHMQPIGHALLLTPWAWIALPAEL